MKNLSLFLLLLILFSCKEDRIIPVSKNWNIDVNNPFLNQENTPISIQGMLDNPCVLKDSNGLYLMYFNSKNEKGTQVKNNIYRATSSDGLKWDYNTEPILIPSNSEDDFDFYGVEAPSILFYKDQFHMYYQGIKSSESDFISIGHAISEDGINWLKSGEIIKPTKDIKDWNGIETASPSAVIFNDKVYLCFSSLGIRNGNSQPINQRVIGYSLSNDGINFDSAQLVLSQGALYKNIDGYEGYANPIILEKDGELHLFYNVVKYLKNEDDAQSVSLAIHHASSETGTYWTEDFEAIIKRSDSKWTKREIRSPSVLLDENEYKLYFSGDNYFKNNSWGFGITTANNTIF